MHSRIAKHLVPVGCSFGMCVTYRCQQRWLIQVYVFANIIILKTYTVVFPGHHLRPYINQSWFALLLTQLAATDFNGHLSPFEFIFLCLKKKIKREREKAFDLHLTWGGEWKGTRVRWLNLPFEKCRQQTILDMAPSIAG